MAIVSVVNTPMLDSLFKRRARSDNWPGSQEWATEEAHLTLNCSATYSGIFTVPMSIGF